MFQTFIDEKQVELLERVRNNTIVEGQLNDRNMDDQNNGALETEINCVNPLTSRRRGRPQKRLRSEGETQKITKKNKENQSTDTNDIIQKKIRRCKRC